MKNKVVLQINSDNMPTQIVGSWVIPDERIANFEDQKDIGWHIFYALQTGAREVIVKVLPGETE